MTVSQIAGTAGEEAPMFNFNISLLYALLFVLALIFTDTILGIAVSIKNQTFSIDKLPRFLETEVLPYYISLVVLGLLAQLKDMQNLGTTAAAWSAIAAYTAKIVWVDILAKVKELFGINVPSPQ
jgi:hypothetical protein